MAQSNNPNVLVFGPTGGVGGAAALEAHQHGAHVWLAMRDTSKSIKGLSKDGVDPSGYSRIQADLTDPDSLKQAVKQSGATAAFIYRIQTQDSMLASIKALKEAGITYIVFLSSFSVRPSPHEVDPNDFIAHAHATIELALEESGVQYTAVRPAYFNSNLLMWNGEGIKKGEVDLYRPDFLFDYISPQDIGIVCGALLAGAKPLEGESRPKSFYLCGPELLTQTKAFGIVSNHLNREIKINELGEDEWIKKNSFLPEPILRSLLRGMTGTPGELYEGWGYEEATKNIKKYSGRDPTKLEDWVAENIK